MKLSANFSLNEMTRSQTATRRGLDNSPTDVHQDNLQLLCEKILQPCRDHFGPITVTSGYRSDALNEAIGGSTTSQHSKGQAADFSASGASIQELGNWIRDNLEFDQLIFEFLDSPSGGWIHCSYFEPGRNEVLTADKVNGKTVYTRI